MCPLIQVILMKLQNTKADGRRHPCCVNLSQTNQPKHIYSPTFRIHPSRRHTVMPIDHRYAHFVCAKIDRHRNVYF